jgi:cytochrome P450
MNALFLHSEVADPYSLYAQRLATQPVCHDASSGVWAVYSYATCKAILDSAVHIPPLNDTHLLSDEAAAIVERLVRLSNPPQHEERRRVAEHLHTRMAPVDVAALMDGLLPTPDVQEFDWVSTVCKVLPPLAVLHGLRFTAEDAAAILPHAETLTHLMRPGKNATQIDAVNAAVATVRPLVAHHLQHAFGITDDTATANLIGLLIQSVDAGRGLLSNALLQVLEHAVPDEALATAVIETMRFDPPIHNTRRMLTMDMQLKGCRLREGDTALLVLAAANRDPAQFSHPERFDPVRPGNDRHLGFGMGMHACLASHFSVWLAVEALRALRRRYAEVELRQSGFAHEALVNARLTKAIRLGVR